MFWRIVRDGWPDPHAGLQVSKCSVMICATLVNTQTDRLTHTYSYIMTQRAELKTGQRQRNFVVNRCGYANFSTKRNTANVHTSAHPHLLTEQLRVYSSGLQNSDSAHPVVGRLMAARRADRRAKSGAHRPVQLLSVVLPPLSLADNMLSQSCLRHCATATPRPQYSAAVRPIVQCARIQFHAYKKSALSCCDKACTCAQPTKQ